MSNYVASYISSSKKQFLYYKLLAEKAMEQLDGHQLNLELSKDANSVATLVQHLSGNMKSRWTDFLTTDGEKNWRNRDDEFESKKWNKKNLLQEWNEGWKILFHAVDELHEDYFDSTIYIRNQGHTVTEAINRQLCHYSYHIGQIVYIAKSIKGESWISLSIPKGKSDAYNKNKFNMDRHQAHFTDEYTQDK